MMISKKIKAQNFKIYCSLTYLIYIEHENIVRFLIFKSLIRFFIARKHH